MIKKTIDFILFYENINREYESLLLLKFELEKRGYSVKICHYNLGSYGRLMLFFAPKVIVSPWLRHDENVARFVFFRHSKNLKLVNLQWEQVYSEKNIKAGLATIAGEARKAYHLCWGKHSWQRLLDDGIASENLFINGPLHLDFCRPEYVSYYESREELAAQLNLPLDKKWCLYISSFSFDSLPENILSAIEKELRTSFRDLAEVSRKCKHITLNWIEEFVQNNPDHIFIYRPHPSEYSEPRLEKMASAYANFKVISLFSVRQWILVADRVGLWISTSCGELHGMGKKYAIIRPLPLPEQYEVEYMVGSKKTQTLEDFLAFYKGETKVAEYPVSEDTLQEYYDVSSTRSAYLRTVDILEKILALPSQQKFVFSEEQEKLYRKQWRKRVYMSLFVELYEKSGIRLGKIFKYHRLKRCDQILAQENMRHKYVENIKKIFKKI